MSATAAPHRESNVDGCMTRLAELFPGIAEESDHVIQLWRQEFGGRPSPACLTALDAMKRVATSQYPQIAAFNAAIQRVTGGAIREVIDQQRQDRQRQVESWREEAAKTSFPRKRFEQEFKALTDDQRSDLIGRALDLMGFTGPVRGRYEARTVEQWLEAPAILQAYAEKLRGGVL